MVPGAVRKLQEGKTVGMGEFRGRLEGAQSSRIHEGQGVDGGGPGGWIGLALEDLQKWFLVGGIIAPAE